MTILLFVLDMIPNAKAPALLVLRGEDDKIDYTSLYDIIDMHCKYYKEKTRSIKNDETEIIIEVRIKEENMLLQDLRNTSFFTQINCISHDGELRL